MSDDDRNMVLMTVEMPSAGVNDLSAASVANFLGVQPGELDAEFGVVAVDPQRNLFAVMISEDRVKGVSTRLGRRAQGPFANPEIAPFGPIEDGE